MASDPDAAEELVRHLESLLETERDTSRRAATCFELGRLHESLGGDLERASEWYQEAHRLDSHFEPPVAGLVRVSSLLGNWEDAASYLDAQVRMSTSPLLQSNLLFIRGIVHESHLSAPEQAAEDFRSALKHWPGDRATLAAVAQAARREEDWEALDKILAVQSAGGTKDKALTAAWTAERARTAETKRRRPKEATEYYSEAFECDPTASSAALSLEKLLVQQERYGELVELLEARADLLKDGAEKAAVLGAAGVAALEALDDTKTATQLFEAAWAAEQSDIRYLNVLAQIYERIGAHEQLAKVLERLIGLEERPEHRLELLLRAAGVLERNLQRSDAAVIYWEKARAIAPADPRCLSHLAKYYEEAKNWERLVEILSEEQRETKNLERRVAACWKLARVLEEELNASEDAIKYYKGILSLSPTHENAMRELSRICESLGRYEEVVQLHERAADVAASDEVRFVHLLKAGQLLEDLLGAPERAVLAYRRILERQPSHLGAHFALQQAALRAKDYETLLDSLLLEAEQHESEGRKTPLLHRAAQIAHENLGQEARALELYAQVLSFDEGHTPTLHALADMHQSAGRFADLLEVLTKQLEYAASEQERAELHQRIGSVHEYELRREDDALEAYRRSYEASPNAVCFGHVERCLARLGRFDDLAAALQERCDGEESPEARAALGLQLGQVYEYRLKDLERALDAYQLSVDADPRSHQARLSLIRVLEQSGEAERATHALSDHADSTKDALGKLWYKLRAAEILESSAQDFYGASSKYEELLEEHPTHPQVLTSLQRIYEDQERHGEVCEIVRRQIEAFADDENRTGAYRTLIRLAESWIEVPPSEAAKDAAATEAVINALLESAPGDRIALRYSELNACFDQNKQKLANVDHRYVAALQPSPLLAAHRVRLANHLESTDPIQALEQHRAALDADGGSLGAARGLSRAALAIDEASLLIEAAAHEASLMKSPQQSARLSVRAAELLRSAGRSDEAIAPLRTALRVCPECVSAAHLLHEILVERGEFEALSAALTDAAQDCKNSAVAAEHWVRVAKVAADRRDDLPAAIAALERLEREDAHTIVSRTELAALYARDRQWEKAAQELQAALEMDSSPSLQSTVRSDLAGIYLEHLGQAEKAARELSLILKSDPTHEAALQRLLVIQTDGKDPKAVETAERLVSVTHGERKAEALVKLADLCARDQKWGKAIESYASAVAIVGLEPPRAHQALRSLLETGEDPQRWAAYAGSLSTYCAHSHPGEQQTRAYLELAHIRGEDMRNAGEAISVMQEALQKNPANRLIRMNLISRLKAARRPQEALPHALQLISEQPLQGESWSDLVDIYEASGKNAEAHLATGLLVNLGQGTDLQKSVWMSRKPKAGMTASGAFNSDALASTILGSCSTEALELLRQLGTTIGKVFPVSLERFGVNPRDKSGPHGSHPVRGALDRVCYCFGDLAVDLYPSSTCRSIRIVLTDPIGIVVPDALSDASTTEQICYLTRYVATVARGVAAIDALAEGDLALLLGACQRMIDPTAFVPGVDEDTLDDTTKRLTKAMPWLSRGRIEGAARLYANDPVGDISALRREIRDAGWRAGMILADDVAPIRDLANGKAALVGERNEDLPTLVGGLFKYWASQESIALRRFVGLL